MRVLCVAVSLVLAYLPIRSEAGSVLTPIDISPHFNWRIQTLLGAAPSFPDGPLEFYGVPFDRPNGGLNAWNGWYEVNGSMEGLRTIDIQVGLYGAKEVFTLINTMGGEELPGTYATLEFYGSDGGFFQYHLDGNNDIRDYLFGEYTNNINGTSTVNVFSAGHGQYNEVRLDMQKIPLPDEFGQQTLDFIRILDNGGTIHGVLKQRLILNGLTVSAVPEPTSLVLIVAAGTILTGRRFRT